MQIVRSTVDPKLWNIVGPHGKILVRGLSSEAAAIRWIDENGGNWPPDWKRLKKK